MTEPNVSRYTRVPVYKSRHEPHGQPRSYGETKASKTLMKRVTEAAQQGNTVSYREYIEGDVKYADAEIIWDADL